MSFHFLIDEFPNEIVLSDGKSYRIETDFKVFLKVIRLVENEPSFNEYEKMHIAVQCVYIDEVSIDRLEEAYQEIFNFLSCYQEKEETNQGEKVFDYEIDSMLIYAAFVQQYGIDLNKEDMHWFKFCALISNLNDGKPGVVSLMQLRSMNEQDIKDYPEETKRRIRKQKRKVSLKQNVQDPTNKASVFDALVGMCK